MLTWKDQSGGSGAILMWVSKKGLSNVVVWRLRSHKCSAGWCPGWWGWTILFQEQRNVEECSRHGEEEWEGPERGSGLAGQRREIGFYYEQDAKYWGVSAGVWQVWSIILKLNSVQSKFHRKEMEIGVRRPVNQEGIARAQTSLLHFKPAAEIRKSRRVHFDFSGRVTRDWW